jgi:alkanesulfonate monooxygenase SsuD/methylene tetrahydromethanopterin reductase-like flavin-dependent oxidoreductase (luciferase family)
LKGLVVFPPGYTSARSIAGINKALGQFLSTVKTREEVERGAYAIVGSPETVRKKFIEYIERLGVGNLLGLFQLGTLPADLTKKSMTLFAQEVMPGLRKVLNAGQTPVG